MWELLICHVCKGLLENPKILTCSHSFCEKCLKEISKQKLNERKCPVCNSVIQVSVDNVFLSNVFDIVKRETNECVQNGACDACSVSGMRNLYCKACDMLLCTQCLHGHHDSVIAVQNEHAKALAKNESDGISTRNDYSELEIECTQNATTTQNEISEHEVGSTRNATEYEPDHKVHISLKCKRHHKEDLRFFCSSCTQLVCQECVIAEHIMHIFVAASDAAPSSRAQLSTLLNQTTARILYLDEALINAKDIEGELRSCVKEIGGTLKPNPDDAELNIAAKLTTLSLKQEDFKTDSQLHFPARIKTLGHEQVTDTFKRNSEDGKLTTSTKLADSQHVETDVILEHENQGEKSQFYKRRTVEIDPQKKALLNDLNKVARRKREVLAKHRRKVETRLALTENCQRFTTNLILNGSDEEILLLENCIMENLGYLCQNTPEVPIECPEDAFIASTWRESNRDTEQGKRDSEGSGPRILTGEGCCSSCFATGEGLTDAIVGQDCTFTVTVKNEQNKPCIEGKDSVVSRIKTPSGGYFKAKLIEHKLGKHKFRYRTYSAGPHILRITLRGEEILGSPFETMSSGSTDYSGRGRLVTKFGRLGSAEGELCEPQGLAVDRLSRIYVADAGNHRIQVFDETGRFLFAFGRKGTRPGEFNDPCDVTISRTGHVIVADRLNDRLQVFTLNGKFLRDLRCETIRPIAVTTDQYNNIATVDSDRSRVLVVTMAGERLRSISCGSSTSVRLENLQDVACNQTGETFLISRIPARNSGVTTATQGSHASLVQVFDNNGAYIREFVTPSYTRTEPNVCRLVTDYDDRVLATGSGNKVQVFTRVGGHLTNITFTEKECSAIDICAIALSPCQAVVVADRINGRILVF